MRLVTKGGDVNLRRRSKTVAASGAALLAALAATTVGCGGVEVERLGDYLEELEFDGPRENAEYAWIGSFEVPLAAHFETPPSEGKTTAWLLVRFRLSAETDPSAKKMTIRSIKAQKGPLKDAILRAVRSCTVEELTDSRYSTLKARITDATAATIGRSKFRQLVLSDYATENL